MWGQLIGAGLSLGSSLLGGSDYQRPAGTIGTDQVLKMLKQGMTPEQIAQIAPMSSRFMANAQRKLGKAGLSPEDIAMLRGGPFAAMSGMGGGGAAQQGPMGMGPFQSMIPGLMSQPALFSNPAAAGWLSSLFGPQQGMSLPPGRPGGMPLGMPSWAPGPINRGGKPGPSPSPFLGLNSLAGPFGNGGGPMVPQMLSRFKAGR